MRHFIKIGQGLDVIPLRLALLRQPELWGKYRFRQTVKANSETECVLLRYQNAPQENLYHYNLSTPDDWEALHRGLECVDLAEFERLPEARSLTEWVMARLGAERLGRVLLAKLPPAKRVYPHDDRGLYVDYYTRVVIPIQAEQGNWSRIGDEHNVMLPGEAWIYDYATEHEAMNESQEDRIHLFVDVKLRSSPLMELPA